MRLLDRLFQHEEINGHNRCETYLHRWILGSTRWFKIYLHHFVGNDWTRDLHDHPKRFISIGLKGWYIESTPLGDTIFIAPWIRSFPATHIHRLTCPDKNTWTLVIVLKTTREWGFWHDGGFIHWRDYVKPTNEIADEMKDC